jgi:hypothetical protein
MKTKLFPVLLTALVFGLISCKKNTVPTVTVNSPTSANGAFMTGDTVNISIDFSDDKMLNEVAVSIVRVLGDTTFFHAQLIPESASASLMGQVQLLTPDHSDFTITAVATDDEGEATIDVSTIHCHPM